MTPFTSSSAKWGSVVLEGEGGGQFRCVCGVPVYDRERVLFVEKIVRLGCCKGRMTHRGSVTLHGGISSCEDGFHISVKVAVSVLPYMARDQCIGAMCRYIPQEILNDDFSALDKANIFMLGASLYELASGAQLPTGAQQCFPAANSLLPSGPARFWAACCL